MLVAQGNALGRINHPGHANADTQHLPVVAGGSRLDRMLNLVQDILHWFRDGDGVVDLLELPLGEINRHRHDVARLEINPDEPARLRVERQDGRGPAKIPRRRFAFEEVTFLDQVIHIDPHRGGARFKLRARSTRDNPSRARTRSSRSACWQAIVSR